MLPAFAVSGAVKTESTVQDYKQSSNQTKKLHVYFSPTLKKHITIPFEISKKAKVTAIIYDNSRKKVNTIFNGLTLNQGHHSINWNGKNNKGIKVKDGSYWLEVSSVTENKKVSVKQIATIVIDNTKPSTSLKLTDPILKMNGANTIKAQMKLSEKVVAHAYIINSSGKKVRKLINNVTYQAGVAKLNWEGSDDTKSAVNEGQYRYVLELTDLAGNKGVFKSSEFTVQDWQLPRFFDTEEYTYIDTSSSRGYNFLVTKSGKVSIGIYQNNILVEEIMKDEVYRAYSTSNFTWDLIDEKGTPFPDGNYQYKIDFKDLYGQKVSFIGNIKLTRDYIKIQYQHHLMLDMDKNNVETKFTLSKPGYVTIRILDDFEGETVKTIVKKKYFDKGTHTFTWDGTTDSGYAEMDNEYGFYIIAENEHGTTTYAAGEIINNNFPSWLKLLEVEIRPHKFAGDPTAIMSFTIETKSADTKVTINPVPRSSSTHTEPLKTESYLLKPGKNMFSYTTSLVNLEYFEVIYHDEFGIQHPYKLVFR
jgi:flagellar hook assembly protein FlgD